MEYLLHALSDEAGEPSDQMELLKTYFEDLGNGEIQSQLLEQLRQFSRLFAQQRDDISKYGISTISTAPSSSSSSSSLPSSKDNDQEVKEGEEFSWIGSEEHRNIQKSIVKLYGKKEFITGPGDLKEVSVSASGNSKKQPTAPHPGSIFGVEKPVKIRYRDGEIATHSGEKIIVEKNPNDDYGKYLNTFLSLLLTSFFYCFIFCAITKYFGSLTTCTFIVPLPLPPSRWRF